MLQNGRVLPGTALRPKSMVNGQLIQESPADFLARYPQALASATITITGTIANNDQLRVNVNLPALVGGKITKTVTLTGSDTVSSAAQKIAKALSDDAVLRGYGAYATSLLGVVTFNWPGFLGNNVTLTQSVPVGAETITLGNSGILAGGSGPVVPFQDFDFQYGPQLFAFRAGEPALVSAGVVKAMAAAGSPIS